MATIREIKKRIIAVGAIQRITKTMQMIATAKFTASLDRAKKTRPYTDKIRQLVSEVSAAAGDIEHPLIDGPAEPTKRSLLLVITSERGMCGAYNANVLRLAMSNIRRAQQSGGQVVLECSGKKGHNFFRFQRQELATKYNLGDKPKYEQVERIASRYIAEFSQGAYDTVSVAYMKFISNARQTPEVLQLLPLRPSAAGPNTDSKKAGAGANYEFSPSSADLLGALLPLTVKTALFQAFNDAVVSEQIMKMVAMKSATENAKEVGRDLKRSYNRIRQAKITTELTEIIGGAAALE